MTRESDIATLRRTYAAFNARDIDGALSSMKADVIWPNGMEGGTVHGRDGVRDYWTRQWDQINPHVEPAEFDFDDGGRIVVRVHQVVRDRAGNLLLDRMVEHIYTMLDGLVCTMEISD